MPSFRAHTSYRDARQLLALAVLALIIPVRDPAAQYCIGHTAYVVRDESGAIMRAAKLRQLSIKTIDRVALYTRVDSATDSLEYVYDRFTLGSVNVMPAVRLGNPLQLQVSCGQIEEMTLAFAGKTMRLLFNIREHNTNYEIIGPPFARGTFKLSTLRCSDGARPPMIDNNTVGKCVVAADAWQPVESESVRRPVTRELGSAVVEGGAAACHNPAGWILDAITTRRDWETAWRSHATLARSPLPAVDFATQFVLIVYRPELSLRPIRVDENGDLAVPRLQGVRGSDTCSVLYIAVDRDGVRSIAGHSLP